MRRGENGSKKRIRDPRRLGEALWYGGLLLVFFVVIVAGLSTAAAVNSTFCSLCHGSYADGLEGTAHAGLGCGSCHDGSSYFDTVESRLAVVEMVFAQAIPGGSAPSGHVFNDDCLACHQDDLGGIVGDEQIRMSHRAVIEADWSCTRCHEATGHGDAAAATGVYTMESCLSCHTTNPGNIATCEICHVEPPRESDVTRDPQTGDTAAVPEESSGATRESGRLSTAWEVTHGPNASSLHGMGDLDTCASCHIRDFCASCHGLALPHEPTYLGTHGSVVLGGEVDQEACYSCHQPASCDTCHQVEMPHPEDFLSGHADAVADYGKPACSRCHSEETCLECHARHIHPGVPSEVLDKLRKNPVT